MTPRTGRLAPSCGPTVPIPISDLTLPFIIRRGPTAAGMIMVLIEAKLRLDGRRMDTVLVQALPDRPRERHVACGAFALEIVFDLDVQRGDHLGVAELPHVQVVAADDAREQTDVVFDVVHADACGHGLEQDAGCGEAERDGGGEDDDGDDEGYERVGVEAPGVVG